MEWTRQIDNTRFRSARNNAKPDQNFVIVWRKVSARPPKVSRDPGRSPGGYNAPGGSWIGQGGQDIQPSAVSLIYHKNAGDSNWDSSGHVISGGMPASWPEDRRT